MGNSQSISLLSYGILEEYDTKTFKELYPSLANDPYAQSYLNEVDMMILLILMILMRIYCLMIL